MFIWILKIIKEYFKQNRTEEYIPSAADNAIENIYTNKINVDKFDADMLFVKKNSDILHLE